MKEKTGPPLARIEFSLSLFLFCDAAIKARACARETWTGGKGFLLLFLDA